MTVRPLIVAHRGASKAARENTLEAFADHGTAVRTVDSISSIVEANQVFTGLEKVGVDMADVARVLESEGVSSFVKSFDELLATLQGRAEELRSGS